MARRYYNKRDKYGRWAGSHANPAPRRAYAKQTKAQRYAAYQTRVAAQKKQARQKKIKKAAVIGLVATGAVVAHRVSRNAHGASNYQSAGRYGTASTGSTGRLVRQKPGAGLPPMTGSNPVGGSGPKHPASGGKATVPSAMATGFAVARAVKKVTSPPGQVPKRSDSVDHTIDMSRYTAVSSKGTPYKNQRNPNIGGFKVPKSTGGKGNGIQTASKANAVPVTEATPATARKASGKPTRRRSTAPIVDPMDLKASKTSYGSNYSDVATREVMRHKIVNSTGGEDIARQAIKQLKEKPVNKGGRPKKKLSGEQTAVNEWGQTVSAAKMAKTAKKNAAAMDAAKNLLGNNNSTAGDYIDAIFEKYSTGGSLSAGDKRLLRKEGLID